MLSSSEKEAIDKGSIVLWTIWTAILLSLFAYVLICHLVGDQVRQNPKLDIPLALFRNILYFVSIITLIMSYLVRKAVLVVRSSNFRPVSQQSVQPEFVGKYTVAMIIALAFSESIGIYGLVLYFIGDSFQTLYTFTGVSALAMFFYRPKREEIETLANDMKMESTQSEATRS